MYTLAMRTTVEISDEHRAALIELAARRGEKGFSAIVDEAIAEYLSRRIEADRKAKLKAARAALGSFSDEAADALRASVKESRTSWR